MGNLLWRIGCWFIGHDWRAKWFSRAAIHGVCDDCGASVELQREDDGDWVTLGKGKGKR